jgi:hypothetical protein
MSQIKTVQQLYQELISKRAEVQERVAKASRPCGPLGKLFDLITSSGAW